jgi:hypothetical protein
MLVVCLSLRGGPGVFMNVAIREHGTFDNKVLDVAKFTIINPLALRILYELSFSIISFKIS